MSQSPESSSTSKPSVSAELRNINSFTEQNIQTKFYPRKATIITTIFCTCSEQNYPTFQTALDFKHRWRKFYILIFFIGQSTLGSQWQPHTNY